MRNESIRIIAKIPVPINSDGTGICKTDCFKDGNGVVYDVEAIKGACERAEKLPLIRYNDNGEAIVIGVANGVAYRDGHIEIDGIIFSGGTCEEIIFSPSKDVVSMEIESIGLGV